MLQQFITPKKTKRKGNIFEPKIYQREISQVLSSC